MAPPSAINDPDPDAHVVATMTNEPGLSKKKARGEMIAFPRPQKFDDPYKEREHVKDKLAAAFRIFGKYGFDEGVAGHITVRDPVEKDTFYVNPFGVPFSLIKKSDLLRVNEEGEILESGPVRLLNTAAYMIHSAIHKARPDVNAACHSHSIYGRTFCTLGRKLDTITQDSCAFHNDHVLYDSFNGVVLVEEEGHAIAKCLGNKKAALLINHGILTVGRNVEEAVYWFMNMEKCCHTQLMADAAAGGRGHETVKIGQEEAEYTYKTVGTHLAGWFNAQPLFAVIEKETKGEHLQ